jgi:hypothetical protein
MVNKSKKAMNMRRIKIMKESNNNNTKKKKMRKIIDALIGKKL